MKKSYLKSILLCIPICLMLYDGNVKAADATCPVGQENIEIATTRLFQTKDVMVNFNGINPHYYYRFNLNNNVAFCIDHGKSMRNNLTYKKLGTIESVLKNSQTVTNIKKAWAFYENHSGKDEYQFLAQVYIWIAMSGSNSFQSNTYNAIYQSKLYMTNEGDARTYAGNNWINYYMEFTRTSVTSKQLYVWEYIDSKGDYQRLISPLKNGQPCSPNTEPTPEEPVIPTCDIDVDTANKINSCADGGGTIDETTSGTCLEKYVGWNNNKFGEPINSNVGTYCQTYCLKSISETYPGNISKAVNAGRYIVWPNNNISSNTYKINANLATYPLKITLTQKCRIMVNQQQLLSDYQVASQAEASAYLSGDGYGNYVGQVFQNYNNSCSWYQSVYDSAKAKYDAANSRLSICHSEKGIYSCTGTKIENGIEIKVTQPNDIGLLNPSCGYDYSACSSEQAEVDKVKKPYEEATNALNVCNSYKSTFDRANSVLSSFNTCISSGFTNNLDFSADYSVSFEGEGNYTGEYQLYESDSKPKCPECTSRLDAISLKSNQYRYSSSAVQADLINRISQVELREVNMELTKSYDLKEDPANGNYYYYVNKDTNESVNLANRGTNYSTIGFSNMPVSYSSKVGKKYNIKLNLNKMTGSSIKSGFEDALYSQEYVCNYEVTKTTPSECICPSGTKHEGESLDCLISNMNESGQYKYTCSEAQYVYCDSETNISDYVCPGDNSNKLTCPNDPSMDLTACVNEGYSYNYCSNTFCNGKHYVCPSGTNEGMNLDACVIPMILKGYSEKDAYEYCKDTTCPYGGIKIIYRTISLQNPFPSYNADKTVDQTGLSVGMFNDTVKGRYPGKNWNSTVIVKSKILNNRNVDGDSVYSKEPLYTFTLTTDTIKNIRKYNKSQKDSYSNFDLNCLINNSIACVSEEFVHNTSYGLTGGTCNRKLTASNFYTCERR